MTTGEQRPRKSRKAWNLWIITAFALMPVALAVGLWGIDTYGGSGTGRLVFSSVAYILVLAAILCFRRGQTRKLAAAAGAGERYREEPHVHQAGFPRDRR